MTDPTPFIVADVVAWRRWLDANEHSSDGVWLVLAKKGTTDPTSLTYAEALDEALRGGWIDGQRRTRDADTYMQRFTPDALARCGRCATWTTSRGSRMRGA